MQKRKPDLLKTFSYFYYINVGWCFGNCVLLPRNRAMCMRIKQVRSFI